MPTGKLPLIKGDSKGRIGAATDYRDQLMVNMLAVPEEHLGSKGYLLTYPGISGFGVGYGIDHGGAWNERFEKHYRVSGSYFVEVSEAGEVTILGNVPTQGQASLAQSFNTQAIVASGRYYLYDPTEGFREVLDSDLGQPIDVTWVDGYYFFTDGENIYHTDITDESSIDPLKFATAEFAPDRTIGVAKDKDNQVLVFGRYSIEYFFNRATSQFAFQRIAGKAQKKGIVGTHCKTELAGSFFYLGGGKGESPTVYALGVGSSTRIATREVDYIIKSYSEQEIASGCVMEGRSDKGLDLLTVNLPQHTLVYNLSIAKKFGNSQAWTITKSDVIGERTYRGINAVYDPRISKFIVGDKRNQNIGVIDDTVTTHYGECAEAICYSPLVKLAGASINSVSLDTIPGLSDGKSTIAVSRTDNGIVYGTEYFQMYAEGKNYDTRFILRRLGYVRDEVGLKFRVVSPTRVALCNLEVDYG